MCACCSLGRAVSCSRQVRFWLLTIQKILIESIWQSLSRFFPGIFWTFCFVWLLISTEIWTLSKIPTVNRVTARLTCVFLSKVSCEILSPLSLLLSHQPEPSHFIFLTHKCFVTAIKKNWTLFFWKVLQNNNNVELSKEEGKNKI